MICSVSCKINASSALISLKFKVFKITSSVWLPLNCFFFSPVYLCKVRSITTLNVLQIRIEIANL